MILYKDQYIKQKVGLKMDNETLDTTQFTGTTAWYRFIPLTLAVLTDGSKYVAEKTY